MPKKKTQSKKSKRKKRTKRTARKKKVTKKKTSKKKTVKKKTSSKKKEKLIGKVTHFFGKINVAAIKLGSSLKVGDKIKIVGGEKEFEQKVTSMELNHKKIKRAKKGNEVGLKVKEKVREGYRVFKL